MLKAFQFESLLIRKKLYAMENLEKWESNRDTAEYVWLSYSIHKKENRIYTLRIACQGSCFLNVLHKIFSKPYKIHLKGIV